MLFAKELVSISWNFLHISKDGFAFFRTARLINGPPDM
jgi:hypothetical protein